MQIEEQVTSLQLSQRLNQLGVKQDSLFYWVCTENANFDIVRGGASMDFSFRWSAFTVAELGLMLPNGCGTLRDWDAGFTVYCYEKTENGKTILNHYHTTDTEADARAKAVIYLIENDLIKL